MSREAQVARRALSSTIAHLSSAHTMHTWLDYNSTPDRACERVNQLKNIANLNIGEWGRIPVAGRLGEQGVNSAHPQWDKLEEASALDEWE